MSMNYAFVGGDERSLHLINMYAKNNTVYLFGFENSKGIDNVKNIIFCDEINQAIKNADYIISGIPFSKDGKIVHMKFSNKELKIFDFINNISNKTLIAGAIKDDVYKISNKVKIIDIMKREDLTILNTIATAEGTITLMISNTIKILHGSKALILGFGRVAKILANKLKALDVNVTCAARKKADFAWIRSYGYDVKNINQLDEDLRKYDFIINTVPEMILNKKDLLFVNKNCYLIDLASYPGGIDREGIKELNLKFDWALALPGKFAPYTSAQFIKEAIKDVL